MTAWDRAYFDGAATSKTRSQSYVDALAATLKGKTAGQRMVVQWMAGQIIDQWAMWR